MRDKHLGRAQACLAPVDAVQRGMIEQVLRDREIEVERARLEHHAQAAQCLAGVAADVVAEDADMPGLHAEQPRDQREQRALAGAVEAEQGGEARRRDRKTDVVERPAGAVGMADAFDRQRGAARDGHAVIGRLVASE